MSLFKSFLPLAILQALCTGIAAQAEPLGTDWIQKIQLPKPKMETLPNGLELVWFEDARVPLVDLVLFLPRGFRQDPRGKSGTATLLGAALDRGTKTLSAAEISKRLDQLGAAHSINIDDDYMIAGIHGLSTDFDALAQALRWFTLDAVLPEKEIRRSQDLMLDSIQKIADYPQTLSSIAFRRIVTSQSPYARGSTWTVKELKGIRQKDVADFHRGVFRPDHAVLMVIGKLPQGVSGKERITSLFGPTGWPRPKQGAPEILDPKGVFKNTSVLPKIKNGSREWILVDRPGATQAQIRMGFVGPMFRSPDRHALAAANALLGRMFHSRLNTVIRDQLGLTYSIESQFSYYKDLGVFQVASSSQNESVVQLIQKTEEILKDFLVHPPSTEDVERAKEFLIGEFPVEHSNAVALASRWLSGRFFGLGDQAVHDTIPKIAALKQEDVARAIRSHFKMNSMVTVIAGDAKAILAIAKKHSEGQAKKQAIRQVPAKDLL